MKKINYKILPDKNGHFAEFGGRYVSETLIFPLTELLKAYNKITKSSKFQKECNGLDFRSSKFILKNQEEYQQVFSENKSFTSNLSILDVLFNLGPETTSYLERQSI